jgi:bifunctional non-homologous end joining protein LigD
MTFIAPMLCSRLENPARLADRRYIAEPKIDGQRAQVHIREGRTVACYSRLGRDLLRHPGMACLRIVEWPMEAAVLDGEACAGDGHEGIQAVFEERNRVGGDMSFMAFDLLKLDGQDVMREPWKDRRKRLEDVFASLTLPRVGLVPVTEDAATLYETWVGWGGEGIVRKQPTSIYRPGIRSPAWLKVKPKLALVVIVTGGSPELIPWGDWGQALMLELRYKHPRDDRTIDIRQGVRVRRDAEVFALHIGQPAELLCWGVMPSGMLRHPLFVRWSA